MFVGIDYSEFVVCGVLFDELVNTDIQLLGY
jgi:hypothetical protein